MFPHLKNVQNRGREKREMTVKVMIFFYLRYFFEAEAFDADGNLVMDKFSSLNKVKYPYFCSFYTLIKLAIFLVCCMFNVSKNIYLYYFFCF